MENKQTAVEYLEQAMFLWLSPVKREPLLRHIEQAKQIEKEQIMSAYRVGKAESTMLNECNTTGEQYYNETYGK